MTAIQIRSTEKKGSNLVKHWTWPSKYYKPILDMIGPEMAKKNNGRQIYDKEQKILFQVKRHGAIPKVRGQTAQRDSTRESYNTPIRRGHC
jgi:hypothetical protein